MEKTNNYHHGNLRQTLIEIACADIREKGVDGLSLRAIAKKAGVSANAPYRHFADKRALLIAIAIVGFEELKVRLQEVEQASLNILEEFSLKGMAYVKFAGDCPEKYKLMFGPAITDRMEDESLAEAAGESYEMLLTSIQRGIDAGVFKNQPVQTLADPIWSMMHGISSLLIDGFFEEDFQSFRGDKASCPIKHMSSFDDIMKNNLNLALHGIMA
ncbi:TetR/AcrR family transcriptional regulator [Litoribrevibacter euphylliae]|uniref:TetR/AcrR family transcriptional regulator n=1 Tax=Litoribrevibacter euphylliae TaxID=1834034 RepID=A0ABV7HJK8_9GAMM